MAKAPARKPGKNQYRQLRRYAATLRYSRRSFRRVVLNSGHETWARLHERGWRDFGACRDVVLDNLKKGVVKPDAHDPSP